MKANELWKTSHSFSCTVPKPRRNYGWTVGLTFKLLCKLKKKY